MTLHLSESGPEASQYKRDVPATWQPLCAVFAISLERLQCQWQSHETWVYMNWCLTGAVRAIFENRQVHAGFEARRRILRLVRA